MNPEEPDVGLPEGPRIHELSQETAVLPEGGERTVFKRRGHIVLTLLAVLVLVGLVPLSTVSWKLIDINQEALTTSQQAYQLLLASSIADELDAQVEGLSDQLQRVAQTLGFAVRQQRAASTKEIRQVLTDVADERMPYLVYSRFRSRGVESISVQEIPDELEPLLEEGMQQTAAVHATQPALGTATASSPVLLSQVPPRAVMLVSAPVLSRGSFRGVLQAVVDLEAVWVEAVGRTRTGHVVFALDQNGGLFASSDPIRVRPGTDVSSSPLVRRFLSSAGRAGETMPFTQPMAHGEGVSYLGSFEESRRGWGVFVQAPRSQVDLPIFAMKRETLTWALAALLLAGLAAMFFARTLSDPINRLAGASRAFARGDFEARVEVRSRDEIGELAHTFNSMAAEIQGYIQRLRKSLKDNRELFLGTIRAMAQAIDAKDPYTKGHSVRVNRYSVILGRQLDLCAQDIADLHVASLLHDVGKIGIDDSILRKPGALTDEEFVLMKQHPVLGANIMKPIRTMKRYLPGLRWHHERANGTGYPDRLEGEQIPMMARIIAVADTFDAITTVRPYQQPMTFERAVARVNELKSTHLDDRVVEAFNRACHAGLIRLGADEASSFEPVTDPPEASGSSASPPPLEIPPEVDAALPGPRTRVPGP